MSATVNVEVDAATTTTTIAAASSDSDSDSDVGEDVDGGEGEWESVELPGTTTAAATSSTEQQARMHRASDISLLKQLNSGAAQVIKQKTQQELGGDFVSRVLQSLDADDDEDSDEEEAWESADIGTMKVEVVGRNGRNSIVSYNGEASKAAAAYKEGKRLSKLGGPMGKIGGGGGGIGGGGGGGGGRKPSRAVAAALAHAANTPGGTAAPNASSKSRPSIQAAASFYRPPVSATSSAGREASSFQRRISDIQVR
jgi:hypothetical protein